MAARGGCVQGHLAEQSRCGEGAVGSHNSLPRSSPWELLSAEALAPGSCLTYGLSRLAALPVPVYSPAEPGLMDGPATPRLTSQLDLGPAFVTTDLPGHHQAVSDAGNHLQTGPAPLTLVVWDGDWPERPCPTSPGTELSSRPPGPQGAAGPCCALTTDS